MYKKNLITENHLRYFKCQWLRGVAGKIKAQYLKRYCFFFSSYQIRAKIALCEISINKRAKFFNKINFVLISLWYRITFFNKTLQNTEQACK